MEVKFLNSTWTLTRWIFDYIVCPGWAPVPRTSGASLRKIEKSAGEIHCVRVGGRDVDPAHFLRIQDPIREHVKKSGTFWNGKLYKKVR